MKLILLVTILGISMRTMGQSASVKSVTDLSDRIFNWEIHDSFDSLEQILDENFRVVTSKGEVQTKTQYIANLRSGTFTHDSIMVEQHQANIVNQTAVLTGRGRFHMTVSGNKVQRHLSFMEVFVLTNRTWKLLALYASVIPE
jgi:hypothetical protein